MNILAGMDGSIEIEGTLEELEDFAETVAEAIASGIGVGHLLGEDGVSDVVVRVVAED